MKLVPTTLLIEALYERKLIKGQDEAAGTARAICPVHAEATKGSLSVMPSTKYPGSAFTQCWSTGCTTDAVIEALDLIPKRVPADPGTTQYEARREGKVIPAVHKRVDHGPGTDKEFTWEPGLGGVPQADLDLYKSWDVSGAPVVVVEGERACDALRALGINAVGTYGSNHTPTDRAIEFLQNREVIFWPDNDQYDSAHPAKKLSQEAFADLAKRLRGVVRTVDVAPLSPPAKWDAADATPSMIHWLIDNAPRGTGKAKVPDLSRSISDVDMSPPPPLLLGRLHPLKATVLFGDGGVGKGTLATKWLVDLVLAGINVLVVDYEDNETEWAARSYSLGLDDGPRRTEGFRILSVSSPEWEGPQGNIWDQVEYIRATIEAWGIGYICIDSAVFAVGGKDVTDPEVVIRYFKALTRIGLPSLTLAHVNRAKDMTKPFGSVFWHNAPRLSWSYEHKTVSSRKLTLRKNNQYPHVYPTVLTVEKNGADLPIHITEESLINTTADELESLLTFHGPQDVKTLTEFRNLARPDGDKAITEDSVRTCLNKSKNDKGLERFIKVGKAWAVQGYVPEEEAK